MAKVDALQIVLEELYGFKVYNKQFRESETPVQIQAHEYLTDFAAGEDGDAALLIVYCAGHGYYVNDVDAGDIELAGEVLHALPSRHRRVTHSIQLI